MFPHLNLEDQVRFGGERNVTNTIEETDVEEGITEERSEENVETSSINGTGSIGNDSTKRIRKRSSWMKEYMI